MTANKIMHSTNRVNLTHFTILVFQKVLACFSKETPSSCVHLVSHAPEKSGLDPDLDYHCQQGLHGDLQRDPWSYLAHPIQNQRTLLAFENMNDSCNAVRSN